MVLDNYTKLCFGVWREELRLFTSIARYSLIKDLVSQTYNRNSYSTYRQTFLNQKNCFDFSIYYKQRFFIKSTELSSNANCKSCVIFWLLKCLHIRFLQMDMKMKVVR